jgi:hypothetical protein
MFKIILILDHELVDDKNIMIFIFEQKHSKSYKSKTEQSH